MSTPRGYRIRDGNFEIDPIIGPKIVKLFELYAKDGKLLEAIRNSGLKITHADATRMMANPRYLGCIVLPRLISDELFNALQERLDNRKKKAKKTCLIDKIEQKYQARKYYISKDYKPCEGELVAKIEYAYSQIMEVEDGNSKNNSSNEASS